MRAVAKLPGAAVQVIVGPMATHKELANTPLSDEAPRGVFLDVVYELLKQDGAGGLFGAAAAGPAGDPTWGSCSGAAAQPSIRRAQT